MHNDGFKIILLVNSISYQMLRVWFMLIKLYLSIWWINACCLYMIKIKTKKMSFKIKFLSDLVIEYWFYYINFFCWIISANWCFQKNIACELHFEPNAESVIFANLAKFINLMNKYMLFIHELLKTFSLLPGGVWCIISKWCSVRWREGATL